MIGNKHNISLPLAVFLAYDSYDYVKTKGNRYISATSILKPIKELVLTYRGVSERDEDIINRVASSVGTACHTRLEEAFKSEGLEKLLEKVGYGGVYVNINPLEPSTDNTVDIYMEKRTLKQLGDYMIGGKFDLVIDGQVRDLKTTKTFSYVKADWDNYIKQGSIYRWLNQDLITSDIMVIDFIFTNWVEATAKKQQDYPQLPVISKELPLMSLEETELMLKSVIEDIDKYCNTPLSEIPECTPEDMWQDPTIYAYYSSMKAKRATKLSNSYTEASLVQAKNRGEGYIEVRKSMPKKCEKWCSVSGSCDQYQRTVIKI